MMRTMQYRESYCQPANAIVADVIVHWIFDAVSNSSIKITDA